MDDQLRASGGPAAVAEILRCVVGHVHDHAVFTLDTNGAITSWNLGAERLFGWPRDHVLGREASHLLGAGATDEGIELSDLEKANRLGCLRANRRLRHRDGTSTPAETTIVAVANEAGLIGYGVSAHRLTSDSHTRLSGPDEATFTEIRRQLSESRALLAAAIADRTQAEESSARLLRRLVVSQEDERRRLARELHDGLGQRLTALKLTLERLEGQQGDESDRLIDIADALEVLRRIDQDVDFIAWELRPAALDDQGLAGVLDTYLKEWSRHACIPTLLHVRPRALPRLAPEIEASIYRLVQEGLNNVAKHAQARSVTILLELRDENLRLIIEDDGIGFQPGSSGETMMGLTGMRERAGAVGGTVEFEPTSGGGTTLLACIPITADRPGHSRIATSRTTAGHVDLPEPSAPEAAEANGAALSAIRGRLSELQRAIGARDEFIATVAHELRNPIAPLIFQVRLALTKTEQFAAAGTTVSLEWIQTQLRGVERRLHRLLETLDRLLDVSRLSTGRIDLQAEPMNLADVVREVVEGFDAELAVARCRLTLSVRNISTGSWDRLRVEQVCRNLLSNAIRFGAGRPIEVAVEADDEFARLMVRDHGVGIPHDQQSKIFERFERGVEQRSGGFGIGLWIVRSICVAMGGSVSVESTPGDGACFTVMLPRRPARTDTSSGGE